VNTAAVERPELVAELATPFGTQCSVIAIDAARRGNDAARREEDGDAPPGWEVVVRSGRERTGIDAVAWAREATERGAGEVLLTSWDRDGTHAGYDLDLVRAVSATVGVPVIASGGAASADDLAAALEAGADAVLAASIFHDGETTVAEIKASLRQRGVEVRP